MSKCQGLNCLVMLVGLNVYGYYGNLDYVQVYFLWKEEEMATRQTVFISPVNCKVKQIQDKRLQIPEFGILLTQFNPEKSPLYQLINQQQTTF